MSVTVQSKPKLPSLFSLLLVVALGISLAKLMWLVLTPEKEFRALAQEIGQIESTRKEKVNYGKLIANQHLFGVIKKAPAVTKEAPKQAAEKTVAPPKKLNLKLHGIVAYKSKKGFALISSNNGPQKVFEKGDALEDGVDDVKVSDIFPEKVIIDNNGTLEELVLPINRISKSRKSSNSGKIRKRQQLSFGGKIPKSRMDISPSVPQGDAPDISGFRTKAMSDPKTLMQVARPSPAIVNGQFIGYRVQPGQQRKFFRKLGFRPNDIITEVNGIILDSPSKGAMILGELSQAADLSVTVKRGDQIIHIQHTF